MYFNFFLGAIELFVDRVAQNYPVFLDFKPQIFEIGGKKHVFRFEDNFRSILINGHKFPTNFGGQLPMVIYVGGREHIVMLGKPDRGVKDLIGKPMPTRDQILNAEPLAPEMANVEDLGENSNGLPNQIQVCILFIDD